MSEVEDARAYLLECFEPDVLAQPNLLLAKRRAWRAGEFLPAVPEEAAPKWLGDEATEEAASAAPKEGPLPVEWAPPTPREKYGESKKAGTWGWYLLGFLLLRILSMALRSNE